MTDFLNDPVISKFLRYVAVPTMSQEDVEEIPSTKKQFALAEMLVRELKALGLSDARSDSHGYVYGTLPGAVDPSEDHPVIGMIAHMDTSCEAPDEPIRPSIRLYEGKDLLINEEKNLYLSESQFPEMGLYKGKHLIVTDGTTLLGGDDKAGVAEIMAALERIVNEKKPHRTIKVAFTPDEEVGRGAELFDIPGFGADYAYTIDGGRLGELEYENFNAASGNIFIHGINVHPGSAKGKMVNANLIASEIIGKFPSNETPATTEKYEGYYHLLSMQGSVEYVKLHYIIRDHDRQKFEARKAFMQQVVDGINEKYGQGTCEAVITDSYFNMKEEMMKHPEVIKKAEQAFREMNVPVITQPIRGGTDGATLTLRGLPCPNICTGDNNAHSRFEYVCAEDMITISGIIYRIWTD